MIAVTVTLIVGQSSSLSAEKGYSLPKETATYLKHNKKEAQRLFEKDCTKCHSEETALSRRAHQDWLLGITYRHGKSKEWIPENEARKIFFHLIVHLEPELKEMVSKGNIIIVKNWSVLLCILSGILTLLLLITTFSIAYFKKLRVRWFKFHKKIAKVTIMVAIFHGGLCLYLFVLR